MSFVAIIYKNEKQRDIEKMNFLVHPNKIIYISEKNIDNMKNVKFETILIEDEIPIKENLSHMISNCKYLILNSDSTKCDKYNEEKGIYKLITYGFHYKDTVTFSSLTDNSIQVCLQKNIKKQTGEDVEPYEFFMKRDKNEEVDELLEYGILQILYK